MPCKFQSYTKRQTTIRHHSKRGSMEVNSPSDGGRLFVARLHREQTGIWFRSDRFLSLPSCDKAQSCTTLISGCSSLAPDHSYWLDLRDHLLPERGYRKNQCIVIVVERLRRLSGQGEHTVLGGHSTDWGTSACLAFQEGTYREGTAAWCHSSMPG